MAHRPVLLYVEDEDAAAFLFESAVTEAGIDIEVRRVVDGNDAMAYLTHGNGYSDAPDPDLILLDLNLPRKNGLEVLAEVQTDEKLRRIPVVVFTSSALPRDRKRSIALGAKEFITKPHSYDALVTALKGACARLIGEGSCGVA